MKNSKINDEELVECFERGSNFEFNYKNKHYNIEPKDIMTGGKTDEYVIWESSLDGSNAEHISIAKNYQEVVKLEVFDNDTKCFLDIQNDVTDGYIW